MMKAKLSLSRYFLGHRQELERPGQLREVGRARQPLPAERGAPPDGDHPPGARQVRRQHHLRLGDRDRARVVTRCGIVLESSISKKEAMEKRDVHDVI